jgi:CheY-like chemotaxis protein
MGLGLSLSADTARQHSGSLRLAAGELSGACFEVFIPRHTGLEVGAAEGKPPVAGPSGTRILAVDDDVAMVRAYRRTLGRDNVVVGVHGGQEALDLLERDERFDIVLCDLMMPGLDGMELYERLAQDKPHLLDKLIFLSGGPTTSRCEEFVRSALVPVLSKPIDPAALNAWIAEKCSS